MKHASFLRYREVGEVRLAGYLRNLPSGRLDEQGVPAYTNPNPLMCWLFWQRVKVALRYLEQTPSRDIAVDFGCGFGVMLPYLDTIFKRVLAFDLDVDLIRHQCSKEPWTRVQYFRDMQGLPPEMEGSTDVIVALDVLEHVDDLPGVLAGLHRLLKPDGRLLVSGPTENVWYRMGRSLAGYSGHYHERSVGDVIRAMERDFDVRSIATLYWPISLFRLVEGRPRQGGVH